MADLYDGDWIDEVGTRDGWPAETLEKNRQTTDAQREGFRKAVAAGVRLALRHGQRRLSARAERPAAPLPRPVRDDAGGGDPLGDGRRGGAHGLGATASGALAPGYAADLIAVEGDPLADVGVLADVPIVMKGGTLVKDARASVSAADRSGPPAGLGGLLGRLARRRGSRAPSRR